MSAALSQLAEHPVMVRTGWMLVHSLWQGAVIALLTWGLLRVLRTPAAQAAAAFPALLAMLFCLPVTWMFLKPDNMSGNGAKAPFIEWEKALASGPAEHAAGNDAAAPLSPPVSPPSTAGQVLREVDAVPSPPAATVPPAWTGWTACAWLGGVLLLGLLRAGGWIQVWRWRTRGVEPAPPELNDCLRSAAAKTGVLRTCGIRLSRLVRSPLLCGAWRPVILFPLSLLTKLDRAQIEALLIHELTHLRRRDFLLNSLQIVIETLLFYHPAVWWAGRRLRECREHACDDAAVHAGAEPLAYAKTLACLGEQWNTAAVSAGSGSLLMRVRRVLTGREAAIPAPALTGLLPVLAAFLYFGIRPEARVEAAEPEKKEEAAASVLYRYRWQRWGDRGNITDRRGIPLASHAERWTLLIEPRMVREDYQRLTGKAPPQRPSGKPNTPPADDIPAMAAELFNTSGVAELKELATSRWDLRVRFARWLTRLHAEVNPWPVSAPLAFTEEQAKRLREATKDWHCARIVRTWQREYPLGARAAHVLGYATEDNVVRGKIADKAFLESPGGRHSLGSQAAVGRMGVEKLMDTALRGEEWYQNGHFDSKSGIVFDDEPVGPVNGKNVRLTLDARMQCLTEEALRFAGVGRGAAVLLDVRNGDILALASVPNFDPAEFSVRSESPVNAAWGDEGPLMQSVLPVSTYARLFEDPVRPMQNRALSNQPPGSVFKIITALAGARAGQSLTFNCAGSVQMGPIVLRCVGNHGALDLPSALQKSCNCYFAQLGESAGIVRLAETAQFFGIGVKDGQLSEISSFGFIGTPEWKTAQGGKWMPADTALIGMGMGNLNATPLQMANVAAAIANGGRIWKPRLVLDALPAGTDPAKKPLPEAGELSVNLLEQGVKPEALETIRRGMWRVVNEQGGTGARARSDTGIAGKTGTALKKRRPEGKGEMVDETGAWFIAFAPYDAPRYALAVYVENGKSGGRVCAPIGRRILEQAMEVEKTMPVPLRGDPVKGHFAPLDEVVYPEEER